MWKQKLQVAAIGGLILWCLGYVAVWVSSEMASRHSDPILIHECWTGPPAGHAKDC